MDGEQIQKQLAELWKKYLPEMSERVGVLERACAFLREGNLSDDERKAAMWAAHKLAGSMGTFGRTRGTEVARKAESVLQNGSVTVKEVEQMQQWIGELRRIVEQE